MAILAVKIDNPATLRMNEFFDYAGHCWALSRNREGEDSVGAELEDFYEGTVQSGYIEEVPVIFVHENQVIGWYTKAVVYRYIRHPALFLEGNICADIGDVRLLKVPVSIEGMDFGTNRNYLVIENVDTRYAPVKRLMLEHRGPFEVLSYAKTPTDRRAVDSGKPSMLKSGGRITGRDRVEGLLTGCEAVALQIMEDRCPGIGTVKALYELAQEVTRLDVTNVNGWYYLAMADYQLGFVRKGLRAIDRAIRLEPDGDDLLVLKGNLLVSNGCMEEALRCYEEAYEIHPEDSYYIMAGKACACMGNPIAAAQYYRKVSDPDTLKAFEIKLTKKKRI